MVHLGCMQCWRIQITKTTHSKANGLAGSKWEGLQTTLAVTHIIFRGLEVDDPLVWISAIIYPSMYR